MKLPRFFVSSQQIASGRVYLSEPDQAHVTRVLRLGAGDRLMLLDGQGKAYLAVLAPSGQGEVSCLIERELAAPVRSTLRITLAQGIPKGDKMDLIIQKGTELGIDRLMALCSERVVVKLAGDKPAKRRERWQRIALEAAKQCRRPDIPEICGPLGWAEALAAVPPQAVSLMPWEEETAASLKDFLRQRPAPPPEVYVFIGPEGGFSRAEVERAKRHGVLPVTLGPRILRTETAGLAVLAMLQYHWGDLGG